MKQKLIAMLMAVSCMSGLAVPVSVSAENVNVVKGISNNYYLLDQGCAVGLSDFHAFL